MSQSLSGRKSNEKTSSAIILPQETHIHCSNRHIGKMSSSPSLIKISVCASSIPSKFNSSSIVNPSGNKLNKEDNIFSKFNKSSRNTKLSLETDIEIYSLSDVSSFDLDEYEEEIDLCD